MFNRPYQPRSALKAPSTLSVATGLLQSEKGETKGPQTRSQLIPIPDTPTIMMPGYSEQSIRRPSYTYSASNQFCTSEASTMLDSLFDFSEVDSWTPESTLDSSMPSEAMSWSSSSFADTMESSLKEEDIFSIEASNESQASIPTSIKSSELESYASSLPATSISPSEMHLTSQNPEMPALMQPTPMQPTPLLTSWLYQILVEENPEFMDVLSNRQTHSESPMTASRGQATENQSCASNSLPSMATTLPMDGGSTLLQQRNNTVPDLSQVFAQVQFAASSSNSSSVIKAEDNVFTSPYHLGSSFSFDNTPLPTCSILSLPNTDYSDSVAPARAQFGTTNSLSDLSSWKFAPSRPQPSRGSPSSCSDISINSKKRRASGVVTDTSHTRRKGAKSFRRFSCLSKEVDVFNGSMNGDDTVKSEHGAEKSTMSFSISQDITLKARPNSSEGDDEQVDHPKDLDLYQRCLQARAPPTSKGDDPPVETNASIIERCRAGEMDIYTPRWSRGAHRERDGWCHLCEEGGWYSMKRSQYLYHLQYDHGVSSQTKKVFDPPKALRIWNDAVESTEGLCGCCNSWIPICFGPVRKRNFKVYFKHIHACQRRNAAS